MGNLGCNILLLLYMLLSNILKVSDDASSEPRKVTLNNSLRFVVEFSALRLTEYCREEFAKFSTFLTSKKCRNWSVFLEKNVVLVVCYDRSTSAVIG